MTKFFANHRVTKGRLSSGYENKQRAMAQAEWLADTYGGVAIVSANVANSEINKYSTKRGWH